MNEQKGTGILPPHQVAALNQKIDEQAAEIERLKNKINKDSQHFEIECLRATLELREQQIAHLLAAQEKSWSAADEALLAEHEAEMAKVVLGVVQFCRQCEYRPDPGSCSDCSLQPYGGGK